MEGNIGNANTSNGPTGFIPNPKLKLLDQVSEVMRFRHYSVRTERTYREWIKRFIVFHGKRHPREMGAVEVGRFLSDLAVRHHVASSTQNQAFNALLFLYREVLHLEFGQLANAGSEESAGSVNDESEGEPRITRMTRIGFCGTTERHGTVPWVLNRERGGKAARCCAGRKMTSPQRRGGSQRSSGGSDASRFGAPSGNSLRPSRLCGGPSLCLLVLLEILCARPASAVGPSLSLPVLLEMLCVRPASAVRVRGARLP